MDIPFAGNIVALLTGAFGYIIALSNNRNQIKAEERRRKEERYYGFIGELVKLKSNELDPSYEKTQSASLLSKSIWLAASMLSKP